MSLRVLRLRAWRGLSTHHRFPSEFFVAPQVNDMLPADPTADEFSDRVLLDCAKRQRLPDRALAAVLEAHRLLGLTLGVEIAERRNESDLLQNAVADRRVFHLFIHAYQEMASILLEHVQKIHESHRAHYSPEMRFRILRVKQLLVWTQEETAKRFDVAPNTIARWERQKRENPERRTLGSLVRPAPPVRRFDDVVRHVVQTMAASGFGGNQRIAQTLARAGWKLAAETVRRIRKEDPAPIPELAVGKPRRPGLKARYPNHVTMADLTEIPSLFRLFAFKLAVVFDVFSRFPLTARVFPHEPSGSDIVDLFLNAVQRFGPPRHFVSDRGSQLTSDVFREALRHLDIRHRFGALGKAGSIALIERLWRSAKSLLGIGILPPLTQLELERRVQLALFYYAYLRPHQALEGATPAEIYFGLPPAHLYAVPPPRARPREGPLGAPFRITFLDRERFLPVLIPKAA